MATTPPPPSPSSLRIPTAPRHGAGYDQFEPYPTRFSARLANQRASRTTERTPEPVWPGSPSKMRSRASPKKYRRIDGETMSPPGSSSKSMGSEASKPPPNFTFATSESELDISGRHHHQQSAHSQPHSAANEALPTPAKTPSKRKVQGDLSSTSRTLFPSNSRMSAKKPSPFSLESFEAPASKDIQIFTDSRDRIPVAGAAEKNPFASKSEAAGSIRRAPRRMYKSGESSNSQNAPVTASSHGNITPSDDEYLSTPEDGMTMIFRGKKVHTKFEFEDEDEGNDEMGLFAARPDLLDDSQDILNSVKPLTRNSVKPRVLFPGPKNDKPLHEEEAATDEEDSEDAEVEPSHVNSTLFSPSLDCPPAPGATRLLRSNARFATQVDETPSGTKALDTKRKRISPFDQWLRKKQAPEDVSAPTTPAKRQADRTGSPVAQPSAKKTRSARGGAATAPLA
ncbi:uncharacterized protein N7482_003514 [Penicillium canariense]|uniref:Uncharacterized protein n=1 Tax=Penicillium canariense TaxID=189055 RepID=A0A9W9LPD8_9EURO|nr:uncharacterized protein N7482_003514 [Penicillium canariense]KAJ5167920.1 hypothetical protein N7482_003514 [Penicillium canariense]